MSKRNGQKRRRVDKSALASQGTTSSVWEVAPLKASFMIISILGFLITAYIVYPKSKNFGVAFLLVFAAMFVASLISTTKAPVVNE
ncbi:hypothetical protein J4421_04765 [Candidatus Woesearchaeota archaeon]|nr:hypothetical protein [Candidatus Woesearchaeota archaeon]